MGKQLISEQTIKELIDKGSKTLEVPKGTLITPLATERALAQGIKFVEPKRQTTATPIRSVQEGFSAIPLSFPGDRR